MGVYLKFKELEVHPSSTSTQPKEHEPSKHTWGGADVWGCT